MLKCNRVSEFTLDDNGGAEIGSWGRCWLAWAGTLSMLKMRNLFISSIASYTSQYDDPTQHHLHSQATVSGGDLNRKPAEEDMLGASAKETLAIIIVLCYEAMQHITRGSYCDTTCGVNCGST